MNGRIILAFVDRQRPGLACGEAGSGIIVRARYRNETKAKAVGV
jgi:hypothetical protein